MPFPPDLENALLLISMVIEAFGVLIIIFGVGHSIYRIARIEILQEKRFGLYENTKRTLSQKMILALDFFVAADLVRLTVLSSLLDVMLLAIIVAIRTVLSWSLSREVHLHKE